MKKQKIKTYADYLKQGNNINPERLAPISAHAKYSKGWNPKYEFKQATIKAKPGIGVESLEVPEKGYLVRIKREKNESPN